jgi:glutamyl-tRNA reductase
MLHMNRFLCIHTHLHTNAELSASLKKNCARQKTKLQHLHTYTHKNIHVHIHTHRAERIRQEELRKAENKLGGLSVSEKDVVDRITRGIVNKLLHGECVRLFVFALFMFERGVCRVCLNEEYAVCV